MKKIIIILIMMSLTYVNSQEQIGSFNAKLENSKLIQKSLSVYNNYTKNTCTFLFETKKIHAYLLDEKLIVKNQLLINELYRKYNNVVGKIYDSNNIYKLILANKEKSKFAIVKFNFNLNKVSFSENKLNTKNLLFLQSVNKENISHLLFLEKKTSNIISKNYFINDETTTTNFNVGKEKFLINNQKEISLSKLLADYKKPNHREIKNIEYELTKVNESPYTNRVVDKGLSYVIEKNQVSPTSIALASRYNKLYITNNDIIITLDKNRFYTQILTLNLDKGSYIFERIKKPLFNEKNMYKRSNSFIYKDNIFLVGATKNRLIYSIYSLKDKNKIKQFEAIKNQPISFKNSLIIQDGGGFNKHRSFEETNKFLRKISESNIGIGVVKNNNLYEVTIGSEKLTTKASSTTIMFISLGIIGFSPNLLSTQGFSSPTSNSFFNYLTTKSIKINCLFDENFNHIKGKIKDNTYDKIANFIKNNKDDNVEDIYQNNTENIRIPKAINLFKINNSIILGAYLQLEKKYIYYKFN